MAHMKRLTMPRSWSLARKRLRFAPATNPGPHAREHSLPLLVVLRDYLGLAHLSREAKFILNSRGVQVDGKVVTDGRRPVGLMDVVSLVRSGDYYRVLLDSRGKIQLVPITKKEATWKLCRIENKTTVRGGRQQLNLHDGRNILLEKGEDNYQTGDTLQLALPDQGIKAHIPRKKGNTAFLTGGSHTGSLAAVEKLQVVASSQPNVISFKEGFRTIQDYVFTVGEATPLISLPEVSVLD